MDSDFVDILLQVCRILQGTQIPEMQVEAGLRLSIPSLEPLDSLLCPDFQPDDPMLSQLPSHVLQQTMLAQEHAIHVFPDIRPSPSRNQLVSLGPQPLQDQLELYTVQEDTNEVHAYLPPVPPASFPNPAVQLGAPTDASPQCPVCGRNFRRPQERNRHVRTYLPHWFFCPFERCPWRGDRSCGLNAHWSMTHANFGEAPKPENCKIYNPDPLVQSVISGESPIEVAIAIALQAVESRALGLDKVGIWADKWGRRQKIRR